MSAIPAESFKWLCLLFPLLLSGGCVSKYEAATKRKAVEANMPAFVDQSRNGEMVVLLPDQVLIIQLVCNLEEGRNWSMVGGIDETILMPDGQRTIQQVDDQDRPVGRPIEEVRFVAVGSGEVIVDLSYGPIGGGFEESMNRFFLKVIVDPFRK